MDRTRYLRVLLASVALLVATLAAGPVVAQSPAASGPVPVASSGSGPSATDPVATVDGFLDTLLAKDSAHLGDYVCAAQRDAIARSVDFLPALAASLPAGFDASALMAGLTLTADPRSVTLVTSDASKATVSLAATLGVTMNEDVLRTTLGEYIKATQPTATDAVIEQALAQALPQMMAQLQGIRSVIAGTADLVMEGGVWVICGGSAFASAAATPGASAAASP